MHSAFQAERGVMGLLFSSGGASMAGKLKVSWDRFVLSWRLSLSSDNRLLDQRYLRSLHGVLLPCDVYVTHVRRTKPSVSRDVSPTARKTNVVTAATQRRCCPMWQWWDFGVMVTRTPLRLDCGKLANPSDSLICITVVRVSSPEATSHRTPAPEFNSPPSPHTTFSKHIATMHPSSR